MVNLATDLDSIRRVVREANQPRLYHRSGFRIPGKTDSHKNAEVRAVLAPLVGLGVRTADRGYRGEAIFARAKGRRCIARWAARIYRGGPFRLGCVSRRGGSNARLLLPLKSNIAPDVGGLAFAILPHGANAPAVCWELSQCTERRRRNRPAAQAVDRSQRVQRGSEWFREQLANGPRAAKDVIERGRRFGFTADPTASLQGKFDGVSKSERLSTQGSNGPCPTCATVCANAAQHQQRGTLGTLGKPATKPRRRRRSI